MPHRLKMATAFNCWSPRSEAARRGHGFSCLQPDLARAAMRADRQRRRRRCRRRPGQRNMPVAIWPQGWTSPRFQASLNPPRRSAVVSCATILLGGIDGRGTCGLIASLAFPILVGDDVRGIAAIELKTSANRRRARRCGNCNGVRRACGNICCGRAASTRHARAPVAERARYSLGDARAGRFRHRMPFAGDGTRSQIRLRARQCRDGAQRPRQGRGDSHSAQFGREMNWFVWSAARWTKRSTSTRSSLPGIPDN